MPTISVKAHIIMHLVLKIKNNLNLQFIKAYVKFITLFTHKLLISKLQKYISRIVSESYNIQHKDLPRLTQGHWELLPTTNC